MEVRFGTDGLRGEAGVPPLDPDSLRRVGAALGLRLQRSGPEVKRVVIGHDGRASAGWIRDALVCGLAGAEIVAVDAGLLTTPALAHLARTGPFVAGIMISASHNPASDNGVKIFSHAGTKLPDEDERDIERLVTEVEPDPGVQPRCRLRRELVKDYEEFLANAFPDLHLEGRTIVVDAAHGGGSELAPAVLRGFGAAVVTAACRPDGNNINDGVGALHPDRMSEVVRREGALLGLCLDGDGDRGIFVDDHGDVRDGDAVMAALAPALQRAGRLPGNTVVATVMSNLGLRKSLSRHGIGLHVTPVGDRAVVQAMREHGYALGGEQSGHIVFDGKAHYTGDGLYTALELLSLPGVLERGTAALFEGFHRYPQLLLNVPVGRKPALEDLPAVQDAVAAVRAELGDDGRVVLRYSGTENLCRVMVEGPDEDSVRAHAERIAEAVRTSLAHA